MITRISTPTRIKAAGNKQKIIEEFIGRVNSNTGSVSIARMKSPAGWIEPGQCPAFDEYSIVLKGELYIKTKNGESIIVKAGEAVISHKGEWVQYSTPGVDGAEYISVCLPAFSPEIVNRDKE